MGGGRDRWGYPPWGTLPLGYPPWGTPQEVTPPGVSPLGYPPAMSRGGWRVTPRSIALVSQLGGQVVSLACLAVC